MQRSTTVLGLAALVAAGLLATGCQKKEEAKPAAAPTPAAAAPAESPAAAAPAESPAAAAPAGAPAEAPAAAPTPSPQK